MNRDNKGFTLVELMIVMALFAVMFSLSWPALKTVRKKYLLENTAEEIRSCLVFARTSAVFDGCRYKVVLSETPPGFGLYREVAKDSGRMFVPATGRWGVKKNLPQEISLEASKENLYFYPNGTSTSAEFFLKDDRKSELVTELIGSLGYAKVREKI